MELIVEDGSIVPNADSWVSEDDYTAYAAGLGYTLDDIEAVRTALRQSAIFIGTYEGRLKGTLVERDQPLCFPRDDLEIDGFAWADDEIPRQVRLCQMQYAIDIQVFGIDPYNPPASNSNAVKREKVEGAVEVEYAVSNAMKLSRNSTSRALLSTLLKNGGLYSITLERN